MICLVTADAFFGRAVQIGAQMATRRTPPPRPERPDLSPEEIRRCITKLQRRIDDLRRFDPSKVTQRFGIPEVSNLEASIDEALSAAFGHGTIEYRRYEDAVRLDHGPVRMSTGPVFGRGGGFDANNAHDGQQYLAEGKTRTITILEGAIRSLQEELEDKGGHDEVADTAPAADRRVRLDHNGAPYNDLIGALDRRTAALERLHDSPDADLKEQQVSEIKAGRELLKPLYVRVEALWAVVAAPLRWMMSQFSGKEIGHLADAVWAFLASLLR